MPGGHHAARGRAGGRPGQHALTRADRALSFGRAAQAYARYRPGYPPEVADLVLDGLDPSTTRALEIGAGTGKATVLMAGRGVRVTAVEPDPAMRAVLEQATAELPVSVVAGTLETLPPQVTETPYDVLYAAAAWHWTDAHRWERAAALLREGGVFASFGGPLDLVDEDLVAAVSSVRDEVMDGDGVPHTDIPHAHPPSVEPHLDAGSPPPGRASPLHPLQWPGDELTESPYFTSVSEHSLASTTDLSSDDFVGLLSTVSAYLVLPQGLRSATLRRVRAVLPATVSVRRDLMLHRAVRTAVR